MSLEFLGRVVLVMCVCRFSFLFEAEDQRERERQLINTEMIPTTRTSLTFFEKVFELQQKIFWHNQNNEATKNHMYASNPLDWPLMDRGIAYWIDRTSNVGIEAKAIQPIWSETFVIYARKLF